MARKKLARRFEPRGGVSQPMLEAESRFIAKELEDYLLLSITDLRKTLDERHRKIAEQEPHLQQFFSVLADRERLALRCMLARDISQILATAHFDLRTVRQMRTKPPASFVIKLRNWMRRTNLVRQLAVPQVVVRAMTQSPRIRGDFSTAIYRKHFSQTAEYLPVSVVRRVWQGTSTAKIESRPHPGRGRGQRQCVARICQHA